MKIGIITLWESTNNYGQILQIYALQEYLRDYGHTPFLIRYRFKYVPVVNPIIARIKRNLSIKKICYIFSKERQEQKQIRLKDISEKEVLNAKREFNQFRNQYIIVSDVEYRAVKQIQKDPPMADVYICGSDQIWGDLYLFKESEIQLLEFGEPQVKRLSYAASMGGGALDKKGKKLFKQSLSRFCAIGVRENSLKELCDSIGYTNSMVVLDPTLLLPSGKFLKLSHTDKLKKTGVPYIFFYIINVSCKEDIYWDRIERYILDREFEVKVVYSSGYIDYKEIIPNCIGVQATVPEWLSYINNAQSVITTSFHGIVFCIKMNRPFLAVLLQGKHSGGNNRIIDLLASLSLSNRILDPTQPVEYQMEQSIDWDFVNKRLNQLIKESSDFLSKALNSVI